MHIEPRRDGRRPASPIGVGLIVAALVVAFLVPAAWSFAADQAAKSLYQRMGGYDVIAGIVDDFISQLRVDHAFDRFGGGRSQNSLVRTRQLIVDQFCALAGGPCVYIGRDMKAAHAGLKITDAEWDSTMKKFKVSLDKFKVGAPEQEEFLTMIGKFRSDIVEEPTAEKPKEEKPKTQN